ncbi:MAG: TonB-dependent receptor [Caldisericota bacterium]|nr:TonB-dependent receptor [Caldisericota bacterium]
MERKLNFAGIIIGMLFLMGYQTAVAAEEEIKLESTIVTATKTEKEISGITASVDVITSAEIKMMGAATLKDIIEKAPGLTMQYGRFPHPSSKSKSAISIRGMGCNGTLMLIDGKRLGGESESPYEMDRIPADMIERIEIVKGPMSTLYGSDALGGVINIITKKPSKDKVHIGLDLRGGMNNFGDGEDYNASFNVRGKAEKLGYTFFAGYNEANPYVERETYTSKALNPKNNQPIPTDDQHGKTGAIDVTYRDEAEVLNTGLSLDYNFTDALNAVVDFNYFKEDREGFYLGASKKPRPGQMPPAAMILNTPVKSVDDNERFDYGSSIGYKFTDVLTGRLRAYRSEYEKRNCTTAINFTAPVNKKFSADVDITGYEAETIWAVTNEHLLVSGAEYREVSRDSCAINPDPTSYEFVNDTHRFKALYLQDEWQITDTINAILGIRYDDISYADNEMTFKAGLIKSIFPLLRLRVNYAEGYRAPDTAELYVIAPSPGDVPRIGAEAVYGPKQTVHTLDPESLKSYELGIGGENNRFSYSIALFFNDAEDKIELERIDADQDGVDDYQTYVNKTDVETKGVEIEAGYNFGYGISANFGWLELDTEDKETGKDLLFNPERTLSLGLDYKVTDGLSFSVFTRHIGRQYKTGTEKADSFTIVDVSFSKKLGTGNNYELYGGVNNIFDEDVDKTLGSNVGPFFFAGIRINY